jgi:DNA-binding transcriptional MerR regulator/methylmalonyl-CoA mutase cobalamin-binding subunit
LESAEINLFLTMEEIAKYPIKYVSMRTGFTQNLIRTWENRYDLLEPQRTNTKRRLYTDNDIEKLIAIKKALAEGMKIGELSNMTTSEIRQIANKSQDIIQESAAYSEENLTTSFAFINNYDMRGFKDFLGHQKILLPKFEYISKTLIPLLIEIGDKWADGKIRISQEHFATAIIRDELSSLVETHDNPNLPTVICCTLKGQQHDLIALAIAAILSMNGLQTVFLGANVPAEEIIATALKTKATAVVISIIYPTDDPQLTGELNKLDKYLKSTRIFIGGAAAASYHNNLSDTGIFLINDIKQLIDSMKK